MSIVAPKSDPRGERRAVDLEAIAERRARAYAKADQVRKLANLPGVTDVTTDGNTAA